MIQTGEISMELREYLSRYTYIEYQSKSWMDRLMYAMPVNRMNKDGRSIPEEGDDVDSTMILA